MTVPNTSDLNFMPTVMAFGSAESGGVPPGVPDPTASTGSATLTETPGRGRLDVAAVVGGTGHDRGARVALGGPGVGPADRGAVGRRDRGRVPRRAAVGRDFDAGDHAAAAVGGGARDRLRAAVGEVRAGGGRGDRRGRRGRVGRLRRRRQPGHQRRGLDAHVGEQVDGRLLHVGIGRLAAGIGGPARPRRWCCPGPTTTARCRRRTPARRWAPGTGSGGASRCVVPRDGPVVVERLRCRSRSSRTGRTRRRAGSRCRRPRPTRSRASRCRRPASRSGRGQVGDRGVSPESQLAVLRRDR